MRRRDGEHEQLEQSQPRRRSPTQRRWTITNDDERNVDDLDNTTAENSGPSVDAERGQRSAGASG